MRLVSLRLTTILLVSLSSLPVSADLVSHWRLNGNLEDNAEIFPPNHGLAGGDFVPTYATGFDGTARGALVLDGRDDYVRFSPRRQLPIFLQGPHSVAIWVRGQPQIDRRIFAEGNSTTSVPVFTLGTAEDGSNGKLDVYIRLADRTVVVRHFQSRLDVFDNTWHHVVWASDGENASIYVDGELDSELSYDLGDARDPIPLNTTTIGGLLRTSASYHFNGLIDDVRVYDHELTEEEIRDEFFPDECSAELTSVAPTSLPAAGGEPIQFSGTGLLQEYVATIGGVPLVDQDWIAILDPKAGTVRTSLYGFSPALEPGRYIAEVRCPDGEVAARWNEEIRVLPSEEPPPKIEVVARETNFGEVPVGESRDLTVTILNEGESPLTIAIVELRGEDAAHFSLVDPPAPATVLPGRVPGGPVVRYDFEVRYSPPSEGTSSSTLRITSDDPKRPRIDVGFRGTGVTPQAPAPPAPYQFETSLAEGTARFRWVNPIPYRQITVLDDRDRVVTRLAGDATFLEVEAAGIDQVDLQFVGTAEDRRLSPAALACALRLNCERPPPLGGAGQSGPLEFFLYGGPDPQDTQFLASCPDLGAGADEGAGAGERISIDDIHSINGALQPPASVGYVQTDELLSKIAVERFRQYRNKITTGFVLKEASDKLEIAAYYEKIATANDLELRGRLRLVYAFDQKGETEFSADFIFPDVIVNPAPCDANEGAGAGFEFGDVIERLLGRGKQWNCAVFFRTDGDPTDPDANQCRTADDKPLKIPAGEYLLDIYAVGGDSRLPYYSFVDDVRDNELLIPGSPCPPYPLVRVTDLDGLRSLPVIDDEVEVSVVDHRVGDFTLREAVFQVQGTWNDESGEARPIDPSKPGYVPTPFFEYTWKFIDLSPQKICTSEANSIGVFNLDFGCYYIDLTVRDKRCGSSKTRRLQAAFIPDDLPCPNTPYTFTCPLPRPGGICAIAGLNTSPPPGDGKFEGKRPVEFRVLVTPSCPARAGACPESCPAPFLGDPCTTEDDYILFRLATVTGQKLPVDLVVQDLCAEIPNGPKYFHVYVDDLGAIPFVPGAGAGEFVDVVFQAKSVRDSAGELLPGWDNPNTGWVNIGDPLQMANHPESLDSSIWRGHFDAADNSYHFTVKSSQATEQRFEVGPSRSINILGVTEVPSKDNDVGSGFTARFMMQDCDWRPEVGSGTTSGEVLSNQVNTAPLQVSPGESSGAGGGAGFGLSDLTYEWCTNQEILSNSFSEKLFEAVLYSGFVGPIPVTIWASIGLGLSYQVDAYASAFVNPFASFEGLGSTVESHFYLLSQVGISIPVEIRADILGGVGYVSVGLEPVATFELDTHVITQDSSIQPKLFVESLFSLYMNVKGCVDLLLTEICAGVRFTIFENQRIIDTQGCCPKPVITCENRIGGDFPECQNNFPCTPGFGAGAEGQGGGVIPLFPILQVTSAPTLTSHPDGTVLGSWVDDQGLGHIYVDDMDSPLLGGEGLGGFFGKFRDPAAAFIAGTATQAADVALVAWTSHRPGSIGLPWPPEDPTALADDLNLRNQYSAAKDIFISVVSKLDLNTWVIEDLGFPLSELQDDPDGPRIDGRAAMAGDLVHGEALVAWVRYETPDFLIEDGTTTIREKVEIGGIPTWRNAEVPNVRPQMERSAIYARRANASGPVGDRIKVSSDELGINIEPTIACSPTGNIAYCVWVHAPGQNNLVDSNLGRMLCYSIYTRTTDSWSEPQPIWPEGFVDLSELPAILQPSISLDADGEGILSFTALDGPRPLRDTGLGGGRSVFISRLIGGVFGEPVLVHGRCELRQFGEWVQVYTDAPTLVDQRPWALRELDALIIYTQTGVPGLRESAGGVMVSALGQGMTEPSPPVNVTLDTFRRTNVAATITRSGLQSINLNQGPASFGALQGVGGGEFVPSYDFQSTPLEPDLAITGCDLSDAFPGPGARIDATVFVENLGLANSPYLKEGGGSAVGIRADFVEEDGTVRTVARGVVSEIAPGGKTTVALSLEMPHDPVRLRVVLDPNPIDRDDTNNSRECLFGAPCPQDLLCEVITRRDEGLNPAVRLSWSKTALYDEVILYRGGELLTAVPGYCTSFVDSSYPGGEVLYEIRGRIGPSKSARGGCIAGLPPQPGFLRGDSNGDRRIDLSDSVFTLNFLFTGGSAPTCMAASDANDDARLDLSDSVYGLNFLFTGGAAPPAPYPNCGEDPTPDLGCEEPHC